jgi:hypothetical protein
MTNLNDLAPIRGEIFCHLFENLHANIDRALFWSLGIDFAPRAFGNRSVNSAINLDWIKLPWRSWKDLKDQSLYLRDGYDGVEASFYALEHHSAQEAEVRFGDYQMATFDTQLRLKTIVPSYIDPVLRGDFLISVRTGVTFTGLRILPDNLSMKMPTSIDKLLALV